MPQKQHNVRLAASRLNNQIIRPGEQFSFNKALGPTTLDNGYQTAFGITSAGGQEHRTVPSVAGGICQVATTLFQPVFWSGYQIEERHWHLYWIPNYSSKGVVGLDATVDEEVGLDLKFVNNSSSFLLIQSRTDNSSVTFELYGTKPQWQVKVDGPKITDQKPADQTPVVEREPSLPDGQRYQVESAREGFTATFVRTVTAPRPPPDAQAGEQVRAVAQRDAGRDGRAPGRGVQSRAWGQRQRDLSGRSARSLYGRDPGGCRRRSRRARDSGYGDLRRRPDRSWRSTLCNCGRIWRRVSFE